MPTLENGPVSLHYETWGDGPAVLLLAPGGLRASRIETWANAPWNPIEALADRYHVIVAMDQRNTGTSFAPITAADGWPSYAADQLALMDHLGIERFAVVGMCIGGAFIMELIAEAPERVSAAVAMQPIGLADNRDEFRAIFDEWRKGIADEHPEATRRRLGGRAGRTCSAATTCCGACPTTACPRSRRRSSCSRATTCTTRSRRRSGSSRTSRRRRWSSGGRIRRISRRRGQRSTASSPTTS